MHYSSGAELNRGSALDLKSKARPVLLTVQAVLKPISFSAFLAAARYYLVNLSTQTITRNPSAA